MSARTLLWIGSFALALVSTAQAAMTISSAKTKNVTCAGGVCTPTGGNANLNSGELQTMLASSDVTVKSAAIAPDIGVIDPLTWTSTHRLTLDAYESIHVRAPVVVEGTSGLTLTTNDGGSGGDYTFNTTTSGAITFWDTASSLVINGENFTLVKDIATLAGDAAAAKRGKFALAASYDASVDGTYSHSPARTLFGVFEGLGNTISNLSIANHVHSSIGLFGRISDTGKVGNLNLTKITMSGDLLTEEQDMGILAGDNDGIVAHVYVQGSISSSGDHSTSMLSGGITGHNNGTIFACAAEVEVSVASGAAAGGIAGINTGTIELSSANAQITVADGAAGALVGENFYVVTMSHATGSVVGGSNGVFGGLAGINDGGLGGGGISNSYATVSVSAGNNGYVGGLIGDNFSGQVQFTYSTGRVVAAGGSVGGLIGMASDVHKISSSDWDMDTSGITNPVKGIGNIPHQRRVTGLTDAQLKSGLPAGFDPNIWGQSAGINNGWPYLLANPPQ